MAETIEVGSLTTQVESVGDEGAALIVLVHGLSNTLDIWQPTLVHFRKTTYRAIAYNQRAHGQAKALDDDYSLDAYGNDLHNIIKYFGGKVHAIIAHSFGCVSTQNYLQKHSGVPAGVILLQSSPKTAKFFEDTNFDFKHLSFLKQYDYQRQTFLNFHNPWNLFTPESFTMGQYMPSWLQTAMVTTTEPKTDGNAELKKNLVFDYRERNKEKITQGGVYVIGGQYDNIIKRDEVEMLSESIKGSVLSWIPTGHMSMASPSYFQKLRSLLGGAT